MTAEKVYIEGLDYQILPDVEEAKKNPNGVTFNIGFLNRVVKVTAVDFSTLEDSNVIPVHLTYIKGEPYSDSEELQFGNLLNQLILESIEARLKRLEEEQAQWSKE